MKTPFRIATTCILIYVVVLFLQHNVKTNVQEDDIHFIKIYLEGIDRNTRAQNLNFDEQIALIHRVQSNVLDISPNGNGIPHYLERRPQNLFQSGQGLCYDRSYVLELIFKYLGFETRHVSLYWNNPKRFVFTDLTQKGIQSHAISEVKTKKGWLIVDSNAKWTGINHLLLPLSIKKLNYNVATIAWATPPPSLFYSKQHHYIYGLYSRHGKFYPPYNLIPDYNIKELLYNIP